MMEDMDVHFHITVEDWPELADRLRTACAHGLPHAFEATVMKTVERRSGDRRQNDWIERVAR